MVPKFNSEGKRLEAMMATTPKEGQVKIKQEAMDMETTMREHIQFSDEKASCEESQESRGAPEIVVESAVTVEEQDLDLDTEQNVGVAGDLGFEP